jgi:hypothetical protein
MYAYLHNPDLFLVEPENDAAQYIEAVDLILVPALVLAIKDIIHLKPEIQSFGNLELQSGIQVKALLTFSCIAGRGLLLFSSEATR